MSLDSGYSFERYYLRIKLTAEVSLPLEPLSEHPIPPYAEGQEDDAQNIYSGSATMVGDEPAVEDKLGRVAFARALAGVYIHTEEKVRGFTTALLGDWGAGKSTVIELLKAELAGSKPGIFKFATFNAWEYEHTDNMAAGMAQEIVRGLTRDLSRWARLSLWVRFTWQRRKVGLLRVAFFAALMFLPLLILCVGRLCITSQTTMSGVLGAAILGSIFLIAKYLLDSLQMAVAHPLITSLDTYLRLPKYGEHLGMVPVLKKDIRTLCELALGADSTDDWVYVAGPFLAKASNSVQKDPKRLVLIVDDLDRCKAECIAQVLDAIRLVMDLENVIVLIAIDHRIALKAIERHYRNVEKKEEADTDGGIAREYLGKIVHLTARLMRPDEHELGEYVIDL